MNTSASTATTALDPTGAPPFSRDRDQHPAPAAASGTTGPAPASDTPPQVAPRTSGADGVALRKIFAMVGVAILCFLLISTYQLWKSIESKDSLRNVEQSYFPALIKADASIAVMEKVSDEYVKAVMTAANDKAVAAHEIGKGAVTDLAEIGKLFPGKARQVEEIRSQFNAYNDEAARMDDDYLNHRMVLRDWLPKIQDMNANLAATRTKLKELRAALYADFSESVAKTKSAMQWNLCLSLALGVMNICFMGVLVVLIRNNLRMMAQISDQNANLEKRVTERTLALRQKTADIQSMLQNMPQGVMTIVAGNKVHPEYSAYLETIFETKAIAERDVMELVFASSSLGADTRSTVEVSIASCIGEDAMNYEFNSHLLATEFELRMADGRVKSLELNWSPIVDESDIVEKVMVCVRDVTELKRLANEASTQRRELEMIGEILSISQEKFQEFVQTSLAFVEDNRRLTEQAPGPTAELVTQLFRNMHTIKGNARTYGLGNLTNTVHEAEQTYDDLRKGQCTEWQPKALLGQLDQVRSLLDEYIKINDNKLGRKGPGRRGNVEKFLMVEKAQVSQTLQAVQAVDMDDPAAVRAALAETQQLLRRIGTERLQDLLASVVESLPSLAGELGKEPPVVAIHDSGVLVRNQVGGLLKNLFTHLLRNAIDHGIEAPAARVAAGKAAVGRVDLDVAIAGNELKLVLRDDGQGMALDRIRSIAVERGLVDAGAKMTDEEMAQLVFVPGFSTAAVVTEVSGRGVGMDAVKGFLEREGGRIDVRFLAPKTNTGHRLFEFVIVLPATFAVAA
jgi:HPt (histidine-containing phosphotransfer) domain-containing protein